ncbi:MAG: hypothetical protein AB1461_09760 [Thermodesulfobacteriota bacterium]
MKRLKLKLVSDNEKLATSIWTSQQPLPEKQERLPLQPAAARRYSTENVTPPQDCSYSCLSPFGRDDKAAIIHRNNNYRIFVENMGNHSLLLSVVVMARQSFCSASDLDRYASRGTST